MIDENNIELLPLWQPSEVHTRLANVLNKAESLRAAVAFWTVEPHYVSHQLSDRLGGKNGFLCVDYHLPTDIDELADLTSSGANVHIFCQKATTKNQNGIVESRHLLHSKLLLFSYPDGTSELWVGSHNWTDRALRGLNIESSLVVKVPTSSALVSSVLDYLNSIRTLCEPFDLSKIEFYKELQREAEEGVAPVISLEGSDSDKLSDTTLNFFGTEFKERNRLNRIGMKVYLAVYDEGGGDHQYMYRARIIQAGEMKSLNPRAGDINFSDRRHAFRSGKKFPRLVPEQNISRDVLNGATYFATIEVGELEPNTVALERPERRKVWESLPALNSALLARMSEEDIRHIFRNSKPAVSVPSRDREATVPYLAEREERYRLSETSPVRKMIIRRKLQEEEKTEP
jgi:HKD family nuclease